LKKSHKHTVIGLWIVDCGFRFIAQCSRRAL
jgi:hypothetical protein